MYACTGAESLWGSQLACKTRYGNIIRALEFVLHTILVVLYVVRFVYVLFMLNLR
jgi:hypothetical protein